MTRKTFVLDTNVLLHDPEAILQFGDNYVVIPVHVLEELDKMKRSPAELGKNARAVARFLDGLPEKFGGSFHEGISIKGGPIVRIELEKKVEDFPLSAPQNKVIAAAYALKQQNEPVVFVSKDFGARIKAEAIGIPAEDYENLKVSYESLYKGVRRCEVEKQQIDEFYKDGQIILDGQEFRANEYCVMTSSENSSAIGYYNVKKGVLEPLLKHNGIWGVKPRNVEQRCALDLLLRDDVKLISLVGPAGTGKTLLALACGLHSVFDENTYKRILMSRPIMPLGRDIGYLPGSKEEKLLHWMQPIHDNLRYLCEGSAGDGEESETLRWVMDSSKIEMEAVTYIRGRTLPKMYIIIDEAQNLTPHEVKTVISRAGEGTKVILAGDPTQIDNPYLDKDSNALTYTVGKFMGVPIFGSVFMQKTERSQLAALAAEKM